MEINDKTMGIVGGIVLVFGMVVLYLQFTAGANKHPTADQNPNSGSTEPTTTAAPPEPPTQPSESAPQATQGGPGSPCGSTSGSCLAETELKSEGCEKVKTQAKLASVLSNPTTVGACSTIEAQLQQGCAPGCQIDPASLVIVPGKIEYIVDPEKDGPGRCNIRGKRPVRVNADCIISFVHEQGNTG